MISKFKRIEELWKEIDEHLQQTTDLYVIGGVVLVYQELKPATKDIDIIIPTKESYHLLIQTLKKIAFSEKHPLGAYTKLQTSGIFEKEDYRLDIFLKMVCNKLQLSNAMMKRAKPIFNGKKLTVYHCANEDIFLFKSMTEREGDLEDNIALAKTGLKWDVIKNEILSQITQSNEDVWITWIGERFDLLIDKGIFIPIMDEINILRDSYFESIEKSK